MVKQMIYCAGITEVEQQEWALRDSLETGMIKSVPNAMLLWPQCEK